jgi:urea transporter
VFAADNFARVAEVMTEFARPFGLPTLTGPFVLATWLFLLPRLQVK